jgi:hypothetical protein
MNGKIIEADENHIEFTVHLDQPGNFKLGQEIVLNLKKQIRTIPQNCLYWVMLDWAIHPNGGGLCRQGRLSRDGLHADIKAFTEENHRHDFPNAFDEKGHFTTTKLTRYEFGLFFDFVNKEIMIEYFQLDMSPFWKDYERLTQWQTTNPGGMSEYLAERMPF